jgi:hypothetical protein
MIFLTYISFDSATLLMLYCAGLQRFTKYLLLGENNFSSNKRNGRCPLC